MNLLKPTVLAAYGARDKLRKDQLVSKDDKLLNQKTGQILRISDISISINDGKVILVTMDERNVIKEFIFSTMAELAKWLDSYRKSF